MAENTTKSSDQAASQLTYLGRRLDVCVQRTPMPLSRVFEKDGSLFIRIPAAFPAGSIAKTAKDLLEKWLWGQARRILHERVMALNHDWQFPVGKITVKDTSSRWGSCSVRGNLNFSWRLVLAPPHILDYLVIHELAHLKEMNHSARFWALVAEKCPDYRNHMAWLKSCGKQLFVF